MTRELFWLSLTVILTGLLWIPYIINRCQVRGLSGAMGNPSRADKPHAEWANRLMFAHDNAVENLVIFAPLVLILNAADYSTKWTVLACAVYFWARVARFHRPGRAGARDLQGSLSNRFAPAGDGRAGAAVPPSHDNAWHCRRHLAGRLDHARNRRSRIDGRPLLHAERVPARSHHRIRVISTLPKRVVRIWSNCL